MPDALSTASLITPAGAGAAAATRLPATPRLPAAPLAEVSVVLLVRDGTRWLAECLDALARQTFPPRRVLAVDLGSGDTSVAILRAHQPLRHAVRDVDILQLPARTPAGRAVDRAVASLPAATGARQLVWVLRDAAAPRPEALARLVEALLRSSSVGVAGPKLVEWDDPRRLVELGLQVTRSGRRVDTPARGEVDQGQHDGRTDVLAVGLGGMLVDRAVHSDLGGFDESFEGYGAALDFGWRAQLAGHRVVVVPSAVVRDASAAADGRPPGSPSAAEVLRRSRRATRQVALARSAPLTSPFLALWIALSSLVAAATLLVAKRPRQAWRELSDIGALAHPVAVLAARWRGRSTRRLRRGDLATLFVSPLEAARTTLDHIHEAITPETRRRDESLPNLETGPVGEESESLDVLPAALPRRIVTHPGFLAVVAVLVATTLAWRGLVPAGALSSTGAGVAGGELFPVNTGSSGLWHAFRDAWHGSGLGSGGASAPALAVLAALTWLLEHVPGVDAGRSPAAVTIAWLLFLGPVLATWSAYLAGRVVSSSRVARAVVAAAWGLGAVVTVAVSQGRLSAVVVHVLLPFVLAGFALAGRRDGTYTATFATALATAVVGAFAPPLLVASVVAALLMVVFGPGQRRLRGFVLLVVPAALLGPSLLRFVADWRLLLSGPGLLDTGPPGPVVGLVLAQPGAHLGAWLWLSAPLVALGAMGYAAPARSRSTRVGLWAGIAVGLAGLAAALAGGRVVLGTAATGVGTSAPARLWEGVGLQLWLAGLLVGLLAGSRVVLAGLRRPRRRRSLGLALVAAVLALVPVGAGGVHWAVTGVGDRLTPREAALPAVAVEQGAGPLATRLLLLRPSATVVDFELFGTEPGDLLRDLDRERPDSSGLVGAVATLVGGQQGDAAAWHGLADQAVGFVQVVADGDDELVRRLDSTEGLSRLGRDDGATLWKVQALPAAPGATPAPAPSRVRLVDGTGRLLAAVPTVGPHAAVDHRLPAAGAGRRVVVAEPTEWADHVSVTLDGALLAPVPGTAQPTYLVPASGGHLVIDLATAHPWWTLAQAVLLGFVCFMALPLGNRRSRRRA
ncbi:glycosyltransferase [Intrasporangium sp.]|uniref:glycosyltransferase n=1 Tax=Intrasporangium sp. TaxID=1925024 RepID=UPI003221F086